jgi:hypothetical protein
MQIIYASRFQGKSEVEFRALAQSIDHQRADYDYNTSRIFCLAVESRNKEIIESVTSIFPRRRNAELNKFQVTSLAPELYSMIYPNSQYVYRIHSQSSLDFCSVSVTP